MALGDVLSAIRAIILDVDDGPTESAARQAWIAERFPSLSESEAEDLANVPAERFGVYTETIFAGERSMLRWAFPMSMAAIGRMLHERDPSQSAGHHQYDFVRAMHRFAPWRSHSVRDLARGFRRFVLEAKPELIDIWPGLSDLIAFEQSDVEVFYAADEPIEGLRPDAWAALSVEALLMLPIVVPAYVVMLAVRFDVLAVHDEWDHRETLPAEWPADSASFVACGRDPETLRCRWVGLDAGAFQGLSALPRGESLTVNDLAGAWLAQQPTGAHADEAAAFGAFCTVLADWARSGVVMAPKNRG